MKNYELYCISWTVDVIELERQRKTVKGKSERQSERDVEGERKIYNQRNRGTEKRVGEKDVRERERLKEKDQQIKRV